MKIQCNDLISGQMNATVRKKRVKRKIESLLSEKDVRHAWTRTNIAFKLDTVLLDNLLESYHVESCDGPLMPIVEIEKVTFSSINV